MDNRAETKWLHRNSLSYVIELGNSPALIHIIFVLIKQAHKKMHLAPGCPEMPDEKFPGGITNGAEWYVVSGGMQVREVKILFILLLYLFPLKRGCRYSTGPFCK